MNDGYDVIIGIDLGATYSGCSYAFTNKSQVIHTINNWPECGSETKVPSLLLYNTKTSIIENEWGKLARLSSKKDTALIECFKLLFLPNDIEDYYGPGNIEYDKIKQENTYKNLQLTDTITEYLKKLNDYVLQQLEDGKYLKEKNNVKYTLTIPCMWDEKAKTIMLEAAILADLTVREDDVTVITELEAAALCFDDIVKEVSLKESYFIVCDAGVGNIHLVTYEARSERENQYLPIIRQVGGGCGDNSGSMRLNQFFESYVTRNLHLDFVKQRAIIDDLLDEFERVKRAFTGGVEDFTIRIPAKYSTETFYKTFVPSGKFIMKYEDIKRMFDNCVKPVVDLIDFEYKKTKGSAKRVKYLLLVGEFSQSIYLQKEVQKWCDARSVNLPPVTKELRNFASYGAVSYGLNPRLVEKK